MIDIFYSLIAGAVQGLTEFLPISSSGHLILLHDFFGFETSDDLAFDVVLHLGTMVALVIFFWKDILSLLKSFFKRFYKKDITDLNQRLSWYLFFATIPAAVVGYFLESQIELAFRNSSSVALMLIIFGVILYLADHYLPKIKSIYQVTFSNAFIIGLAQALALVPGVSRSGITIIAGLSQNLKREDAARFSFLLAIPIVFGAGLKKTWDFFNETSVSSGDLLILAIGFLSSALVGYFAIKYFLKFLQSHSLKIFAYYRIILGLVILGFIYL